MFDLAQSALWLAMLLERHDEPHTTRSLGGFHHHDHGAFLDLHSRVCRPRSQRMQLAMLVAYPDRAGPTVIQRPERDRAATPDQMIVVDSVALVLRQEISDPAASDLRDHYRRRRRAKGVAPHGQGREYLPQHDAD